MASQEPIKKRIVLGAETAPSEIDADQKQVPLAIPFPSSRTLLWRPKLAVGTAGPAVALFVTQDALHKSCEHVGRNLDAEDGGFLLGNWCRCPNTAREFVVIDECTPARYTEQTDVSLGFTAEAWGHLGDELSGKFRGKTLVGWYHSHPKWGIFLSPNDLKLHSDRFPMLWMPALVIDPVNGTGGFFARRPDGDLSDRVPIEFYELLPVAYTDRADRRMPWKGYLPQDLVTPEREHSSIAPTPPASISLYRTTQTDRPPEGDLESTRAPLPKPRCYFWIPKDALAAPQTEYALLVSQEVLRETSKAVGTSLEEEIGGFLLGNRYICPNSGQKYVVIDQWSPALYSEGSSASLAFTPEAWGHLEHELTGKFLGKKLLGWYHSHPKMAVFLSSWDIDLHNDRFPQEWMSALVIVPDKAQAGFFMRRAGKLDPNLPVGFYEYLDTGNVQSQPSIMPWNGYICRDLETGHDFTPRTIRPISDRSNGAEVDSQPPPTENRLKFSLITGITAVALLVAFLAFPRGKKVAAPVSPIVDVAPPPLTIGLAKLDILPDFTRKHLVIGAVGLNEAPKDVEVLVEDERQQAQRLPADRNHVLRLDTPMGSRAVNDVLTPSSRRWIKVDVINGQSGKLIAEDYVKFDHDEVFPRQAAGTQQVPAATSLSDKDKKVAKRTGTNNAIPSLAANLPLPQSGQMQGAPTLIPLQISPAPVVRVSPPTAPPIAVQTAANTQPGLPDAKPMVSAKLTEQKQSNNNESDQPKAKQISFEAFVLQKFDGVNKEKLKKGAADGTATVQQLWHLGCDKRDKNDRECKSARKKVINDAKALSEILKKHAPKNLTDSEKKILTGLVNQLINSPIDGVALKTIGTSL